MSDLGKAAEDIFTRDGGPVFPFQYEVERFSDAQPGRFAESLGKMKMMCPGVTVRDYFIARIVPALIMRDSTAGLKAVEIAEDADLIVDALLARRSKRTVGSEDDSSDNLDELVKRCNVGRPRYKEAQQEMREKAWASGVSFDEFRNAGTWGWGQVADLIRKRRKEAK